jgi:hypothetical protein
MQPQKAKFEGVDFSELPIDLMSPDIDQLCRGFKCVRHEFTLYIKGRLIRNEVSTNLSRCFILKHENDLVGYITLLADKLEVKEPILIEEGVKRMTFPAVKIGWLASDKKANGVGKLLVKHALYYVAEHIAPRIGVRFVTVDALYDEDCDPHYDISTFYLKRGFNYVNEDEPLPPKDGFRSMYFDLKDLIAAFQEQ